MKVIILNYDNLAVNVAHIPESVFEDCDGMTAETSEAIENYLSLELDYHIDSINYMTADDDEPIGVYPCGVDELTATPIAVL